MKWRRPTHLRQAGLILLSALLLTFAHPPYASTWLIWIALIPFVLASVMSTSPRALARWSYLIGSIYWLINISWLSPITTAGWIILCFYMALLWPLMALSLQRCHLRRWPLCLCTALIWVGAEHFQGLFLGGFYWRFLAHSQYENLRLIQIADLFGTAGISLQIAAINGLLADIILAAIQKKFSIRKFRNQAITIASLLILTLIYGQWRLSQAPQYTRLGPRVAAVQTNIPQHVKETFLNSDRILEDTLALSQACAKASTDLIAWPETMIQSILDDDVWAVLANEEYLAQCRGQDLMLRAHAHNNAYLLAGTYGGTIHQDEEGQLSLKSHNSVNLFRPDGTRDPQRYDKIALVLFGEHLPFESSWPWLHELILSLTPYDHDYTLDPGTEYTVFQMQPLTDANQASPPHYRFGNIICYEDTLPQFSRRYMLDDQGKKAVDWLVNISNDGWFCTFDPCSVDVYPSTELIQHVATCVFRSIENRIGILRSVNTGISCLITPTGEVRDTYLVASDGFPTSHKERQGIAGWFIDTMPIDSRITVFTRLGRWLDYLLMTAFGITALTSLLAIGKTTRKLRFSRSKK